MKLDRAFFLGRTILLGAAAVELSQLFAGRSPNGPPEAQNSSPQAPPEAKFLRVEAMFS